MHFGLTEEQKLLQQTLRDLAEGELPANRRRELFEAVVDRVFTQWREALVAELDRVGGGTAEGLRTLFVAGLAYGRARPLLSRLLTRDSQLLLSTSSDAWDRACDAFRELVAGLLEAGVARGEIRGDLPVAAMADLLTETHFAFANRQILSGNAIEPERIEAIVACILDGIRTRRD